MSQENMKLRIVKHDTVNSSRDSDIDTIDTVDALRLASEVGYSLAGDIGAKAFNELELAYATRLLPKFSDDPIIRVNQNVLLYWQHGYYKSTILKVFNQTIPKICKPVDITSMTLERIFGSIDEKKRHIIEPAFTNNVHFVIISELTTLLGQRDAMKQIVNTMNVILEREKVTRQILKLGFGEINKDELSELEAKGVSYDPIRAELSYTPNACVLAATRPLDNRYFTYLNKSGHFSRYHVIQHHVTAQEASQHLHTEYKLDQEALDQLKRLNSALVRIKVKRMLRPSESLMKPIYVDLEALVQDEVKENPRLTFADVVNPRLKDDVIRELVAHAFLGTASQNGLQDIEELEYTQEDVNFILERLHHFIEFAVDPIIAPGYMRLARGSKKDKVKAAAVEFLSDGVERHIDEIIKALDPLNVCQATVYNALNELKREDRITSLRFGYYQIVRREENN